MKTTDTPIPTFKRLASKQFFECQPFRFFIYFLLGLLLLPVYSCFAQTTITYSTAGTYSWPVPAGVTSVTVQAWGGGGGGGGSINNNNGAGGGGGGAFSSLVVNNPSGSYSVVVGAGGTGGTTGSGTATNGSAGGASSFGSGVLTANGGSGGFGSNNGQTGGAGGAAGTFKGGDGAIGGATGGGGGGGAGTTGAGGNASGATGGTGTANYGGSGANGSTTNAGNGNTVSGGGSGGRQTGGTARGGGDGAAGQVLLTYTCPTYSLTATSATAICVGSATTITLSGNAANLPLGSFTVTYNLSGAASSTGNTVAMTVTTAGTGSFSISSLPVGSTTVTITNLASGVSAAPAVGCNSAIGANNSATVTVAAQPTGPTLNAKTPNTAAICFGTGGSATFNTGSGGTGCSDNFIVSVDGGASVAYTPGTTIGTTATSSIVIQGRRASCSAGAGCSATSYVTLASWTINATSVGGTASSNQNVCIGSQPVSNITLAGSTGTIQWQKSTVSDFSASVTNIGSNSTTLTPAQVGTVSSTTYIRAVVTSGVCTAATSNTITLSVVQPPTTSVAGPNQIGSSTCGLTTVTLSGNEPTQGTGAWSINSGAGGSFVDITDYSTDFSGTAGTAYSLRWTISNSPCTASFSNVLVTFNQVPNIVTSQTASICNGAGFTVTPTNAGGNTLPAGTTYTWGLPAVTGGITGGATGTAAANISGTLSNPGVSTATATYTVTPATSFCTGNSFPVTVSVQPTPTLTSSLTPAAICSSGSTNFNYTATSASAVSFSWTRAAIASINSNTAGNGNSATISETLTNSGTSAVNVVYAVTMTINGCSNTQNVTVTVNPIPTLSSTTTPAAKCNNLTFTYTPTSATPGVSFTWTRAAVAGISNAAVTTPNSTFPINELLGNTTTSPVVVTYAIALSAAGCSNSQNVTVTIYPTPTASASPTSQNICSGNTAAISFSSTVTGTTYAWTRDNPAGITGSGALSGFSGLGNISDILSNSGGSPGTVSFTVTPTANGCPASPIVNIATVQVLPVATVNSVSDQTVCRNGSTSAIAFSGNASSYTWTNSNTGIGLASASGTGNIASFTGLNSGTTYATANFVATAVYTVGATNCNGGSTAFKINVLPAPVLTSATTGLTTCSGSTFNYTPTTSASGVGLTTSFSWTRAAVANINGNTGATGTGDPNEILTNSTTSPINVTYTYTLTSTYNLVSCANPTTYNVVVSVKPTPTVAISPSGAQSICHGVANNFTAITISNPNSLAGTTFSWTRTNGTINTGNIQGIAASGSSSPIPASTLTNSTTSIQNSIFTATATYNGCSSSTTVNVQVNPPIINDISTSAVTEANICGISKQASVDAPPATGGNGSYSYQWQFSSPGNNSFSDIPGETGEDLVYNYSIANAFFRRVATSDACSAVISDEIHINGPVTNSVTLATGNNVSYCSGGSGVSISLNGTISGATYTLQRNTGGSTWVNENPPAPIIGTGFPISFNGITTAGTYRVSSTITTPSSCTQVISGTVTVSIDPLPSAPTTSISGSNPICQTASTNIVGTSAGNTINWYSASTGGSALNGSPISSGGTYSVTPGSTTTYYAEAVSSAGCGSSARTPITVTVRQLPVMTSGTTSAVCSGATFSFPLTASNSPDNFTWQAAANANVSGLNTTAFNTSSINNNAVAITNNTNSSQVITYTVIPKTTTPACSGASQLVYITIDPKPVVSNKTATICSANTFTITPVNGVGGDVIPSTPATYYTWSAPAITLGSFTGGSANTPSSTSVTGTLTNTGNTQATATYTVTPTAGACSGNTFTATVTINPKPFIADQSVNLCSGSTFTFPPFTGGSNIIPAGTTYGWGVPTGTNISGFNVIPVTGQANISATLTNTSSPGVPVTATYTVTPTNSAALGSCAGNSFQLLATLNPVPTTITPTTSAATVCQGASSPNVTFSGFNGIQPYTFTYNITVNGVAGAAQTISTSVGNTVSLPVSTATAGTIVYTITNIADAGTTGCNRNVSTAVTVTVNPNPVISGTPSTCIGSTTLLSGSGTPDATTPWTSASPAVATVSNTGLVSGVAAGTSIITYKNSSGCTVTSTVTVNPLPSITGTLTVCAGSTTQLNGSATPDATTPWTSASPAVATVNNTGLVSGVSAGTSVITYRNNNGCTITASVTVNPGPTLSGISTSPVCDGGNATITLSGLLPSVNSIVSYQIAAVAQTPVTITANAGGTATISIPVTIANNLQSVTVTSISNSSGLCPVTFNTSTNLSVISRPTAVLSGSQSICAGGSASLTITPGAAGNYSGTLNPGGIPFSGSAPAISVMVTPGATTVYSIASLTNTGTGCTAIAAGMTGNATVTYPSGTPGVWTCSVSNDWFDCRNWANGMVPTNATDVLISSAFSGCNPVIDPNSANAPPDRIARTKNIVMSGTGGLSFAASGDLYVSGNWTNNVGPAGFTANAGTVTMMGSTGAGCSQTVRTTTGNTESFYNLVVNNTCAMDGSGDNVILTSPVNVGGALTLVDGIVKTTDTSLLSVTNPAVAAIAGGSSASYIYGPIARNTNSTGIYTFPTGDPAGANGVYRPAVVIPVSSSSTSFTARYYPTYAPEHNNAMLGPTGILENEYWDVHPTGSCTVGAVVGLPYVYSGNASDWSGGVGPCSGCNVAITKPVPQAGNSWYFTDFPNYIGSGFSSSVPESRLYNINGYLYSKPIDCIGFGSSHFTFGYDFAVLLPVNLVSFSGRLDNRDIQLKWAVTDSKELLGFELEYGRGAQIFNSIAAISATGALNYSFTHYNLQPGVHYYRLLIKNKNGEKTYSKTIVIQVGTNVTIIKGLKSNPVRGTGYVEVWSATERGSRILLFDIVGRLLAEQSIQLVAGDNNVPVPTQNLPQGTYNIFIKTDDNVQKNLRIVKE